MSTVPIPFSKRTTAAIVIFACLQASKDAFKLTTVATQKAALNLLKAQLFHEYRLVIHQDTANNAEDLANAINKAVPTIQNLLATVDDIASNFRIQFVLIDIQTVVLNSYHTILAVQAMEE